MHMHKPNHSIRHLSLTVSAHVCFKSRKTSRCSSSWFLFHGQWRNQTLRPFWPVCENNYFLRCATSASISIDGIRLEGDSGCVALILSGSIHARSSAILFYPAWACVDKCPVFFFSDTFEWSTFIFLFDFNSWFLDPCLYLCNLLSLSCLFLTFYLDFFLHSMCLIYDFLENPFFRSSLYLYLAFLCWVELLIGMLNIQHCRLWESVAGWGNEGLQFDWQGER